MIVAVASGKGGTGKTTVAVNLAAAADGPVRLLDCDVEAPNCHLFLSHEMTAREPVTVPVPAVDLERCDGCGECSAFCRFNAIACVGGHVVLYPELCHGCGGCVEVCPRGALSEVPREVGLVEEGRTGAFAFVTGKTNIGEARATPVIDSVKKRVADEPLVIVDAPPGTSCPAVAAVRGADYALLVSEPTPFGLHDLRLAVEMVQRLGLPCGVVVNRADIGSSEIYDYCFDANLPVLLDIPFDRHIAGACACGRLLVEALPATRDMFRELYERVAASLDQQRSRSAPAGAAAAPLGGGRP